MKDDALVKELREIRQEIHTLKLALIGDKLAKPEVLGLLDIVRTHNEELFGHRDTQREGLKEIVIEQDKRLEVLENDRKRIYWMCGGIGTGSYVAMWLIDHFAFK